MIYHVINQADQMLTKVLSVERCEHYGIEVSRGCFGSQRLFKQLDVLLHASRVLVKCT